MCCLGQFSKQAGVSDILDKSIPDHNRIRGLNSNLISDCVEINDDEGISVKEKIKSLDKILKKAGYKLKIVNARYIP